MMAGILGMRTGNKVYQKEVKCLATINKSSAGDKNGRCKGMMRLKPAMENWR
jgi:hypothetical protein